MESGDKVLIIFYDNQETILGTNSKHLFIILPVLPSLTPVRHFMFIIIYFIT